MSSVREFAKWNLLRWQSSFTRAVHRRKWLAERPGAVARYFAEHDVAKLQLGAASAQPAGWLSSDLEPALDGTIFVDATERLPFDDAVFGYLYSEHMIEHLAYDDVRPMLAECRRVLRPGGTIRLATPDIQRFVELYTERAHLDGEQTTYVDWVSKTYIGPDRAEPIFVLNNVFRAWGHQFLYDEATLRSMLLTAGFVDVRRCRVGDSADPHLRGLEMHGSIVGSEAAGLFETMVLEADRPARCTPRHE